MNNRNKGFTLAEMLITVAIIGVMVALAMFMLSGYTEKSKETVDMANIRTAMEELTAVIVDKQIPEARGSKAPQNKVFLDAKVDGHYKVIVLKKQNKDNWQSKEDASTIEIGGKDIAVYQYGWLLEYDPASETTDFTIRQLTKAAYDLVEK